MNSHLRLILATILAFAATVQAEEKNGLSLTVSKTVIEKNDPRTGSFSERINRTQGLKASIKNLSFKEMPEGEIVWTILVKKYYSTTVESYTGTEKLKALKPAEITELVFGAAQITGYRDTDNSWKDKTEWQITVKQDGKEIIKSQSTSAFDGMAKHAIKGGKTTKADN